MSEDVRIAQIGNLPPGDVPLWATEKTLDEVRKGLAETHKLGKSDNKTLTEILSEIQRSRQINQGHLESIRRTVGTGRAAADAEGNVGALGDASKEAARSLKDLKKGGREVRDTHDGFMKNFLTAKMILIPGIYALQRYGRTVISSYKETIKIFGDLHTRGIMFEGSLASWYRQLTDIGLSQEKLAEMTSKNAVAFGRVGVQSFLEVTKKMENFGKRADEASFKLEDYGLTFAQAAEFNAEYIEKQRLLGNLHNIDQERLARGMREQIRSLTAYTRILNVSREDILKTQQELMDRPDVLRRLQSLPEDAREVANKTFEEMTRAIGAMGPGFRDMGNIIVDMLAHPVATASEGFKRLSAAGLGHIAHELTWFHDALTRGATPDEILDQFMNLLGNLEDLSESQMATFLALAGDDTKAIADMLAGPVLRDLRYFQANLEDFRDATGEIDWERLSQQIHKEQAAAVSTMDAANKAMMEPMAVTMKALTDALGDGEGGLTNVARDLTGAFQLLGEGIRTVGGVEGSAWERTISKTALLAGTGAAVVGAGVAGRGIISYLSGWLEQAGVGRVFGGRGPRARPGTPGDGVAATRGAGMGLGARVGLGGGLAVGGMALGAGAEHLAERFDDPRQAGAIRTAGTAASQALSWAGAGMLLGGPKGAIIGGLLGGGYGLISGLTQSREQPTPVLSPTEQRNIEQVSNNQVNMGTTLEAIEDNTKKTLMATNRVANQLQRLAETERYKVISGAGLPS